MGKLQATFDRVQVAVNQHRSKKGSFEPSDLRKVLSQLKIEPTHWYSALALAKREQPNRWAVFQRTIGKDPGVEDADQAEPAPAAEESTALVVQDQSDAVETAPSAPEVIQSVTGEALANVIAWLEPLCHVGRRRVIRSAKAYFEDEASA